MTVNTVPLGRERGTVFPFSASLPRRPELNMPLNFGILEMTQILNPKP
jgi:hypothetical protein